MFQKRITYVLVKKNDQGRIVDAVGSFFRGEIKGSREYYDMIDGEVMEEMAFRKKHPKLYRKTFEKHWVNFIETFLKSLDWIDYYDEVEYDQEDAVFRSSWFTITQDLDKPNMLVISHHVYSNQSMLVRLVNELMNYLNGHMEVYINPVCYQSRMNNEMYFGSRAIQRVFAEEMMINAILN